MHAVAANRLQSRNVHELNVEGRLWKRLERAERTFQAFLLHDIFGNPFRPSRVEPTWLTPGVVDLSRSIYEDRAFDRMPELASALKQADCYDPEILAHCRGTGRHVRGCWLVDLLLGKE